MAIKLHRCKNVWFKFRGHPCWRVQKALDEQGIDYKIVPEHPRASVPSRRTRSSEHGQQGLPWAEFEDGSVYREESKDMAETIRADRLDDKRPAA
jgi:hypothetical protein